MSTSVNKEMWVKLSHQRPVRNPNPNRAEANKGLDQVIATSKDKGLVERVKSFKSAK